MTSKERESGLSPVFLEHHIRHMMLKADNHLINGEFEKAMNIYDEIISSDPDNLNALVNKANALDHLGKHSEAIAWYDSALELDPENAEIWYNKGVTLKKTGAHDEGTVCINNGISLAMGNCIGTI